MREILFRGKRADNNEWVYGYLIKGATRYVIQESIAQYPQYDVIPETIGQYTGLYDKNGKKIFEGDIVEIDESVSKIFKILSTGKVIFNHGSFFVAPLESENEFSLTSSLTTISNIDFIFRGKIIGNIYDKEN